MGKVNKLVDASGFGEVLLKWYGEHARDLPWRSVNDPYLIWVSEVMLQQTQVERVKEYFARFVKRFPTVADLANGSWEDLLEVWRGLGYYRRARNLHAAAKVVANEFGGVFPAEVSELVRLPGIGEYTAGAIACFAFGKDEPAIDTNVDQVMGHVFGEDWFDLRGRARSAFVKELIPLGEGAAFHHALMDVATALRAQDSCPFHSSCDGFVKPKPTVSRKHRSLKPLKKGTIKVAVGALIHEGCLLLARRKKGDSFGGYWEFPGGKVELGEDERSCLKREMKEELGIEVAVRPPFCKIDVVYNGKPYRISFHRCSLLDGEPKALESDEITWIQREELHEYRMPEANDEAIDILGKKKMMWKV